MSTTPQRFVVVGCDNGISPPSLAVGPLDRRSAADAFKRQLERTTSGRYVVLPLQTPKR